MLTHNLNKHVVAYLLIGFINWAPQMTLGMSVRTRRGCGTDLEGEEATCGKH
jgi:hypothetical protein